MTNRAHGGSICNRSTHVRDNVNKDQVNRSLCVIIAHLGSVVGEINM